MAACGSTHSKESLGQALSLQVLRCPWNPGSFRVGKPSKISVPAPNPALPRPSLNPVPHPTSTCSSKDSDSSTGEPLPVPDHHSNKEFFPDIQSVLCPPHLGLSHLPILSQAPLRDHKDSQKPPLIAFKLFLCISCEIG